MSKDQKKFLYQETQSAISKKKRAFVEANPIEWSDEDKLLKLTQAGFLLNNYDMKYAVRYLGLPLTKAHTKNRAAYEALCKKLDDAMYDLKVQVELGDADAVAILKDFLALVEKA